MIKHFAVIGNPVAHSKSPQIHLSFAEQTGLQIEYVRVLSPLDSFPQTVISLHQAGYSGANVTVPFKLEAFALANQLTERAMDAGAVNTLVFNANGIVGDNTDGAGLVQDIEKNIGVNFHSKRVLLIGAGGASEGVLHPILEQQPAMLIITNRTLDKALSMVKKVEEKGEFKFVSVNAYAFDDLQGQEFDIVINATSVGLTDTKLPLPEDIFAQNALAYDMMYGKETAFMSFAREHGAQIISDGLGMLVEQAAEAFYVWHGIRPHTGSVIASMKNL